MILAHNMVVPLGYMAIDIGIVSQKGTERWIVVKKGERRHTAPALLILLKNPAILSC
jgi:hypothetical protein